MVRNLMHGWFGLLKRSGQRVKLPDNKTIFLGCAIAWLAAIHPARAQQLDDTKKFNRKNSAIVDDSTKNVYGPKTTKWTTEDDMFRNRVKYVSLDTSLTNYHRWTHIQRLNNYYKDLGNVGTALSPIFPTIPGVIGVSSGFTSYEPYFTTDKPHFYDTKSPYTRIYIVWGGNGRATTKIEFSRNINPRWNFGFDYRPILVDKQIQHKKADRMTISHYYDAYTTYRSKDERYRLLFEYRRIRHRVNENGGVVDGTVTEESKLFDKDASINLTGAVTEEKRATVHLFQQYQLAKPAQIYLMNDYFIQINKFSDQTSSEGSYYDYKRADSVQAGDIAQLETYQNEAGLKGNAGPLFYNFYYKNRAYDYRNKYLTTKNGEVTAYVKRGTERYVGGRIGLTFDSLTQLSGVAEYLLDGYYKLEAVWKSPWIDASGTSSLSKPGFMQQAYYGSHDLWNNSFKGVSALQLNGFLKGQFGPLFVSPGLTFSTFSNYIYFQEKIDTTSNQYQKVLPKQSLGSQVIASPELRLSIRVLKHVFIRPQIIYTNLLKNDDDAFHIPTTFVNAQVAYENMLFKGNLQVQAGLDFHYKSSYNALAYDVPTQHYYIQDPSHQYISKAFVLADIFFNAKLKRGKFFLKYHNLVQAFTGTGYVPTPGYPGQRNILDFGFELLIFD